ncbi:MAG: 4'-phosphopantetheinyl transferase superfamily protein [Candidatus Cybelea sp.]
MAIDERARYEQFATAQTREEYLAARALCRATLSYYTGVDPSRWRFSVTSHGKPIVTEPVEFDSLRFNLTHTDDLALCIVSRAGEVGVDAEKTSRATDDLAIGRHFFSRRQRARLASLPPDRRAESFFEQWVLKEAYVKATGEGLAYAPERLTIEQDEKGEPMPVANCQFALWRPTPNHVAAAAVLLRDGDPAVSLDWLRPTTCALSTIDAEFGRTPSVRLPAPTR